MGHGRGSHTEYSNDCRFLTFSCFHRLALFRNNAIKDHFVDHLARARLECGFGLIAWVVMPEHIHLLLWPNVTAGTLSDALQNLKTEFAKQVMGRWRELNAPILPRLRDSRGRSHFWQRGGGHDVPLGAGKKFADKVRYIHSNPVTRGLVDRGVDWRWSSACWYRDRERYVGPPCDPVLLPGSYGQQSGWMEEEIDE